MMMAGTFGETLLLHQSGTRAREGETLARNPFSHLGLESKDPNQFTIFCLGADSDETSPVDLAMSTDVKQNTEMQWIPAINIAVTSLSYPQRSHVNLDRVKLLKKSVILTRNQLNVKTFPLELNDFLPAFLIELTYP
eukprot:bmy_09735T0